MPDFFQVHIIVSTHNGKMSFDLYGGIHVSMKLCTYKSHVAFSQSQLLACAWSCQSGSECNNRHTCIHSLEKVYELTLALYNGFAHDILIELWVWLSVSELLPEQEKKLIIATKQEIASAAGVQVTSLANIHEVLQLYATLMEVGKVALGKPNQKGLGLHHDVNLFTKAEGQTKTKA